MSKNPRQTILDLMYLVRCALHEEEPSREAVEAMDLHAVYQMARTHSMGAIGWAGLGAAQEVCPAALAAAWKELSEMATRKALLLDIGREEILGELETAGIWYLPLKGSLLQNYYPAPGLREMSDNDILFDRSRRQDVIEIMNRLGYEAELGNLDDHDVYTKPPIYNYEMHLTIMGEKSGPDKQRYYDHFETRLLPGEDGEFSRRVKEEDFYIHLIAHAHAHYITEGTGLRILADLYVYLQEVLLDWDYICTELDKMNLRDFDSHLRLIVQRIFTDPLILSEEDWAVLDYCESCGTYGNHSAKAKNTLRSMQDGDGPISLRTKIRYLWRRICPDKLTCQLYFPFFAKYPFLKPFWIVYRILRTLLFRRNILRVEINAVTSKE